MDPVKFVKTAFKNLKVHSLLKSQIMVNDIAGYTECDIGVVGEVNSICCDFCDTSFHRHYSSLSLK